MFFSHCQSSLLSAVLGELPKDKGFVDIRGRIAYVSQQPWVFSGTVRSNILFGKEYIQEKYERVLRVCALKKVSCYLNQLSGRRLLLNGIYCIYQRFMIYFFVWKLKLTKLL